MRGMLPRRDVYIRPLLNCSRKELQTYVENRCLEYRYDESNADTAFRRNRIRHRLLPVLMEQYNPAIVQTLNRSAGLFAEAEDYLQHRAEEAYKSLIFLQKKNEIVLEIEAFLSYFQVIQKYILLHALAKLGMERRHCDFNRLNSAVSLIRRRRVGSRIIMHSGIVIMVDHDGIVLGKSEERKLAEKKIRCSVDGTTTFDGYSLDWRHIGKDNVDFTRGDSVAYLDYHKTGETLSIRSVVPGDRFYPLNFSGSRKVSDYLSDRKVPLRFRVKIPIIISSGKVVWIGGYRIDDRYKIDEDTRSILKFEIS
jgi:tRNA(Ile)-lysidine synthase